MATKPSSCEISSGPLGEETQSVSPLPPFTKKNHSLPLPLSPLASCHDLSSFLTSLLPPSSHSEGAVGAVTEFTCLIMCVGVGVGWDDQGSCRGAYV